MALRARPFLYVAGVAVLLAPLLLLVALGRVRITWVREPAPTKRIRPITLAGKRIVVREETVRASAIEVAPLGTGSIAQTLELPGSVVLEQGRFSRVTTRIAGVVRVARVQVGDEVSRGETLASLESVELGAARAAYVSALAERRIAERTFERWKELFEKGLRTQNEFWVAENQLIRAQVAADAALSRLKALGSSDEELRALEDSGGRAVSNRLDVTSPLEGAILDRRATVGEFVSPADEIFTVADLSRVWVTASLPQADLDLVARGAPAIVRIHGVPGEFPGEVTYLGQSVDPLTRTVPLRVTVANGPIPGSKERWALRPALFVGVELRLGVRAGVSVLPRSAVLKSGTESWVLVRIGRENGAEVFERRIVLPGAHDDRNVEIASGVSLGEAVVVEGARLLAGELRRGELGGSETP